VLVRIGAGLGIPRAWMGLAYDEETETLLEPEADDGGPVINLNPARVRPGADELLGRKP
jgi:hypothetical protein